MATLLTGDLAMKQALLPGYLGEMTARRWSWGGMDCAQMAVGWINRLHGQGRVLPAYASYEEASRLLRQHGGLSGLAQALMAEWGFALTNQPQDGDIGLIHQHGRLLGGGAMAIDWQGLWIAKANDGLKGRRNGVLMAWRI